MASRCTIAGCTNFAVRGQVLCLVHRKYIPSEPEPGNGSETYSQRSKREAREHRLAAAAEFRERLATGSYNELLGPRLGGLVAEAANTSGVADELGALRLVLAELMVTRDIDPATRFKLITRVATASSQVARTQRILNGAMAEGLTDAIVSILLDMEAEDG